MKKLSETAAKDYTGPEYGETRWVRASDVLQVPFTLLSATIGTTADNTEKAYLHVMFDDPIPDAVYNTAKDSKGDALTIIDEYTISSSGRAIVELIQLLVTADDFPVKEVMIVSSRPEGRGYHKLVDVDTWRAEQQRNDVALDRIPF